MALAFLVGRLLFGGFFLFSGMNHFASAATMAQLAAAKGVPYPEFGIIFTGGYRSNVIPSEAKATLDVRLHPDEDQSKFLDQIRAVINDPTVEVRWARDRYRPAGASRLNTELFAAIEAETKKHYGVDVLPTMSTGASDKAQIRSKGVQCYGVGPAIDYEDGAKGYGAHSDQERILEAELHKFVRWQYDVVMDVARAR